MTEKDQHEKEVVSEEAQEQEEAQELSEEEEVAVSDLAEEETDTASNEEESNSQFLSQWKERHQAYLASHGKTGVEDSAPTTEEKNAEETPASVSDTLRVPRLKSLRKKDKPQFDTLENEEEARSEATAKKHPPIPRKAIWKSLPVLFVSLLLLLTSIYFMSPYSKEKQVEVTGNQRLSVEEVLEYSLISNKDYTLSTILNKDNHARNILASTNLIKSATISYTFPNTFSIQIEEYQEIGYVKEKNNYYSVLSNGAILSEGIASEQLPKNYTEINLSDKDLVKKLALQLAEVDPAIRSNIQTIALTPSKATADLLTLSMYDGNSVIVPLTEITKKLPYYPKIAAQLMTNSTIDMEVGIYSYANY